jgi:hypothetical protein
MALPWGGERSGGGAQELRQSSREGLNCRSPFEIVLAGEPKSAQSLPADFTVRRFLDPMKRFLPVIVALLALGWFIAIRFGGSISPAPSPVSAKPAAAKSSAEHAERVPSAAMAPAKNIGANLPSSAPKGIGATPADATNPITNAAAAPASMSTKIPLEQVLGPDRAFRDAMLGVALTYPEGWTVRNAIRWGKDQRENTVFFRAPEGSATPSMYYQRYPDGAPAPGDPEALLREQAQQKEAARQAGLADYKNDPDSFVFRDVNGHPALSYFATYTARDQVQAEYFTRVLGPNGYVMFFVRGPVNDVKALIPSVFQMSGTVTPP